ncbi:MAG: HupE/UreJ family protein [Aestuariibacter sp.]
MKNVLLFLMLFTCSNALHAHQSSFSNLEIDVVDNNVLVNWNVHINEFIANSFSKNHVDKHALDINKDGQISGWEFLSFSNEFESLINSELTIGEPHECPLILVNSEIDQVVAPEMITLNLKAECATAPRFINSQLLLDSYPDHQVIFTLSDKDSTATGMLSAGDTQINLDTTEPHSALSLLVSGIEHILIGLDHLAFLVILLLSLIANKKTENSSIIKTLFTYISCFTVAHSITLFLGWYDLTILPVEIIEALIAFTIVFSALMLQLNFRIALPVIFSFGLIHGYGFASVLADLNFQNANKLLVWLNFNIGIELGQILFVATLFPLVTFLNKQHNQLYLKYINLCLLSVAVFWLVERAYIVV